MTLPPGLVFSSLPLRVPLDSSQPCLTTWSATSRERHRNARNENERHGYVPNVVYSCGAVIHGGRLIIPYAMSDYASTFATVPVADVLEAMV